MKRIRLLSIPLAVLMAAACIFAGIRASGEESEWQVVSQGILSVEAPDVRDSAAMVSSVYLPDSSLCDHRVDTIGMAPTVCTNGKQTLVRVNGRPKARIVCLEGEKVVGAISALREEVRYFPLSDGFLEIISDPETCVFSSARVIFRSTKVSFDAVSTKLGGKTVPRTVFSDLLRISDDGKETYYSIAEADGIVSLKETAQIPPIEYEAEAAKAEFDPQIQLKAGADFHAYYAVKLPGGITIVSGSRRGLESQVWLIGPDGECRQATARFPDGQAQKISFLKFACVASDGGIAVFRGLDSHRHQILLFLDIATAQADVMQTGALSSNYGTAWASVGSALFFANGYVQTYRSGKFSRAAFLGNLCGPVNPLDSEYAASLPGNGATGRMRLFRLSDWSLSDSIEIDTPVVASSISIECHRLAFLVERNAGRTEMHVYGLDKGRFALVEKRDIQAGSLEFAKFCWGSDGTCSVLAAQIAKEGLQYFWLTPAGKLRAPSLGCDMYPLGWNGGRLFGIGASFKERTVISLSDEETPVVKSEPLAEWAKTAPSDGVFSRGYAGARFLVMTGVGYLVDCRTGSALCLQDPQRLSDASVAFNSATPDGLLVGLTHNSLVDSWLVFYLKDGKPARAVVNPPVQGWPFLIGDTIYVPCAFDTSCVVMKLRK